VVFEKKPGIPPGGGFWPGEKFVGEGFAFFPRPTMGRKSGPKRKTGWELESCAPPANWKNLFLTFYPFGKGVKCREGPFWVGRPRQPARRLQIPMGDEKTNFFSTPPTVGLLELLTKWGSRFWEKGLIPGKGQAQKHNRVFLVWQLPRARDWKETESLMGAVGIFLVYPSQVSPQGVFFFFKNDIGWRHTLEQMTKIGISKGKGDDKSTPSPGRVFQRWPPPPFLGKNPGPPKNIVPFFWGNNRGPGGKAPPPERF